MAEAAYPPPPPPLPPPQASSKKGGFHGPETHFFTGIRRHLTTLEQSQPPLSKSPKIGLVLALVLGATLSFALSFVVQLQAIGVGIAAIAILLAPITEEIFKGLSILIVTLLVWKAIPNRRYGALLGAAAGLGFSLAENILYSAQFAASSGQLPNAAELIVSRWLGLPFMHVLWSALIGVGIFVFLSQRNASQNTPSWLPLPFLLIGFLAHTVWNIVAVALSAVLGSVLLIIVLNVILVFTPFALLFRDFLGGHFNFQNFLAPQPEPSDYLPATSPPPPPPPPPA